MVIAVVRIILFIGDSNSLKAKRMVLQSLKKRLRNRFNIAVSEIGDNDKWQKATLGIVGVGNNRKHLDRDCSLILNFVRSFNGLQLVDYEMELL